MGPGAVVLPRHPVSGLRARSSCGPGARAQAGRCARSSALSELANLAKKLRDIDAYLATASPRQQAALQALRSAIRAAAPRAEECISYGLPAFRLEGKLLVAFGARPSHCAFYAMSSTVVAAHKDALAGYKTSTGTIRFQPDKPLPAALVRRLVAARIAENRG